VDDNADLQERAPGLVAGIYARLPTQAARLALVLHALTHPEGPASELVSVETVSGALALVEYFRAHAHRAMVHFGVAALVQDSLAIRALRAMQACPGEWLTRSEIHGTLGGHVTAEALASALGTLENIRLIEQRTRSSGGRPFREARVPLRELNE